MVKQKMAPIHPREVLQEEFLKPLGLSQHRLALDIGVDPRRINEIILGKRGVTANTALRWPATLAHHLSSGSGSRFSMTLMSKRMSSVTALREVKVYAEVH